MSTASPTKRRRLQDSRTSEQPPPSDKDIWKWTLSKEAVSPCLIGDVLEMRECAGAKDVDYYWLGRIPCRTVVVVGIVVGLTPYETRTVYTLDDGSGVVECSYRITPSPAPKILRRNSPHASSSKTTASPAKPATKTSVDTSITPDYDPPYSLFGIRQSGQKTSPTSTSTPKKIFVGSFIRVEGRVSKWHDGRQIVVQNIEIVSATHELKHRENVRTLHRTRYDNHRLGPFIPPRIDVGLASQTPLPTTPTKPKRSSTTSADKYVLPTTPKAPHTPTKLFVHGAHLSSKTLHTPSSQASTTDYSESESERSVWSPRKTRTPSIQLRHPSRLHSRDITANTFKIYLKYYMDHARPVMLDSSNWEVNTPRKPSQRSCPNWGEETPKPSRNPPCPAAGRSTDQDDHLPKWVLPPEKKKKSFTLSFLRRVPELAYLARRVVEAEAKRRAKAEREKARLAAKSRRSGVGEAPIDSSTPTGKLRRHGSTDKENITHNQSKSAAATSSACHQNKETAGRKMKRLFTFVIRTLYDEGSIVLWEGPSYSPSDRTFELAADGMSNAMSQGLWKTSSSRHPTQDLGANHSLASTHISSLRSISMADTSIIPNDDDDDDVLSDPQEGEEGYISVTASLLSPFVEDAINELTQRAMRSSSIEHGAPKASSARSLTTPTNDSILSQLGPTQSQITKFLQKGDARWARIGEWSVSETLDELKDLGRVWIVSGQGRDAHWERCL